jgi:hypothetical protein
VGSSHGGEQQHKWEQVKNNNNKFLKNNNNKFKKNNNNTYKFINYTPCKTKQKTKK